MGEFCEGADTVKTAEAVDIIGHECLLINDWINQGQFPDANGEAIKDRDVTRCLLNVREAALHAPPHEAARVVGILALAETRLNSAR
jgi:hypothetical protein